METMIGTIRPLLEVLYFVAGIALTIGLALAYKQLKLLKEESASRSQRAAAEKAIEAVDLYYMKYIPLADEDFNAKKTLKIKSYAGPIGDFSIASLPPELKRECVARFSLNGWVPAMNCLESIAARFTNGVADEGVGFAIIGRSFCAAVEDTYDLIAACRDEEAVGYWSNVVSLYKVWRPRLTKVQLTHEQQALEERLKTIKSSSIAPLK